MSEATRVFYQQDGTVTTTFYQQLSALGPIGLVAMNLFRAQKRSSRAKQYRGRRFRDQAYDVKEWSMQQLCGVLREHGESLNIRHGWKADPDVLFGEQPSHVLYVDLPPVACDRCGGTGKEDDLIDSGSGRLCDCGGCKGGGKLTKQVSFHSPRRGEGPDYPGEWDGIKGASEPRIIQFCDAVLESAL